MATWADVSKTLDGVEKKLRAIRSMSPAEDGDPDKYYSAMDEALDEFDPITEDPLDDPRWGVRIDQLRDLFTAVYYEINTGQLPKDPSDDSNPNEMESENPDPDDPDMDALEDEDVLEETGE